MFHERAAVPRHPPLVEIDVTQAERIAHDRHRLTGSCVQMANLEILEFSSFDDYWQPFLGGSTPTSAFAAVVNSQTDGVLARGLRDKLPHVQADGSFVLPARAWAVKGMSALSAKADSRSHSSWSRGAQPARTLDKLHGYLKRIFGLTASRNQHIRPSYRLFSSSPRTRTLAKFRIGHCHASRRSTKAPSRSRRPAPRRWQRRHGCRASSKGP
jgi:hypothetical protein